MLPFLNCRVQKCQTNNVKYMYIYIYFSPSLPKHSYEHRKHTMEPLERAVGTVEFIKPHEKHKITTERSEAIRLTI